MRSLFQEEVKSLLRKYSVRPSKKTGQNFLTSQKVARDIVWSANLTKDESVLEIGGGLGILTQWIARCAKTVYVVEKDAGLVRALREILSELDNVEIIEGDALEIDFPEVDKVVCNLPYSISSDITFRLLEQVKFKSATLMYQREFAERLLAEPGSASYARLTIGVRYYVDVAYIMGVPASMFYPIPKVDSSVVCLTPRLAGPFAKNPEIFFWLVHGIYSYPNKQIGKALRIWFRNMKLDKALASTLLDRAGASMTGTERLRSLSPDTLVTLADCLMEMIEDEAVPDPRGKSM
ncbi:MAG: ribosomal RNA small subunit methyltransferase A [Candidatus Thorarchaeota archaeon]|nr:ribosomal RNA small subunit methyltransferase A [Candidatus Thorarchaeota archaeon]